jgi:hypothetical protein
VDASGTLKSPIAANGARGNLAENGAISRFFHRDKFAQVSPKCPDPQIAHQRPFMREGCVPATWGRVEKTFQPHWSAQITLRARAAFTTFKTLKTDRGTGFVTGSLIGFLARWGRVGLRGWKPNGRRHHGRVPTEQGGRADNSCGPPRPLRAA